MLCSSGVIGWVVCFGLVGVVGVIVIGGVIGVIGIMLWWVRIVISVIIVVSVVMFC